MKNLVLISLLLVSSMSRAQFVSNESQLHNVQQIKDRAIRYSFTDKHVTLQGYLVEHIREDYYLFKDDSGTIRVEIYPSLMPSTPFTQNSRVTITGEVDLFFLRPEIYVSSILLNEQEIDAGISHSVSPAASRKNYYNYDNY